MQNLFRLVTLTPLTKVWRGRGFKPDLWEQFVVTKATEVELRKIKRMAWGSLIGHALFVSLSIVLGLWFLPIIVTLAPFYGASFMGFMVGIHQHAACETNDPDFRISCGDTLLNPFLSFLYWHMEYHIEHHMFAAIPCFNLKPFSKFVEDQLPPKMRVLPRLLYLNKSCKEKYGSYKAWRDLHGLYKGY